MASKFISYSTLMHCAITHKLLGGLVTAMKWPSANHLLNYVHVGLDMGMGILCNLGRPLAQGQLFKATVQEQEINTCKQINMHTSHC